MTLHAVVGLLVVLYALGMSAAHAQGADYIPRGQPTPQSIRWVNGNPGGASMSGSASWTNAYNQTSHHRFPVNYSAATLGGLAQATVRRGLPLVAWGFALKNIIDGAGWVIDELQQQVVSPGQPREELGPSAYCIVTPSRQNRCASSPGQLLPVVEALFVPGPNGLIRTPCGAEMMGGAYGYKCTAGPAHAPDYGWVVFEARKDMPSTGWEQWENANPGSDPAPISDSQLGELIKDHPQIVNGVSSDPDTGAPRRTQELTNALNALARALEAANGLDPGSLGTINPAPDLSAPVPSQTEWPGFCDWATTVCEFIDWFKADESEPKELPEHQLQINPNSWASGIGGGTCPAPIVETWTFMDTPARFEFDYAPVCQFASMMRPFLIACALICAAFIMAGLRSAGGKT